MKAIIITFNGDYTEFGIDKIATEIANSIHEHTNINVEGAISISFMNDNEVSASLLKENISKREENLKNSKAKKQRQLNKELEDYCKFICNTFVVNTITFKTNYFLNFIAKEDFRKPSIVRYLALNELTTSQKEILKQYSLEELPNYIKELNNSFKFF